MTFSDIVGKVNDFAWGPIMLILLVGTGVYLSVRVGFIQFGKFGYAMKNTLGKIFQKNEAGKGEVTPLQAVTTALAGTVGTGNIAGVTGAIIAGGPGAVFWMWVSALFGMVTKYAEVLLAVKYRERNVEGDWVGGPMYYIKNGMGKSWRWLGILFCIFGALAGMLGIGNMTQVNSITSAINGAIASFGGDPTANTVALFGQAVPVSNIVIGVIVAIITALVILGGIKRIGKATEGIVPVMAIVYIIAALVVIICNVKYLGTAFAWIFKGAFSVRAALGGAFGITIMKTMQKGVARGVFSNEAGLGSAPIAHAASSETNPVKQGLYGIFEVFMDTIVICSLTSLVLLTSVAASKVTVEWGGSGGAEFISAAFSAVIGGRFGSLILAIALSMVALSTILSWSIYGSRCCEYIFGTKSLVVYKVLFCIAIVVGATLNLQIVWDIADTLNGLMAIPNLVALLVLSPVIIKTTKEYFSNKTDLQ